MWANLQFPADLFKLTEEILNGKLHFLCSGIILTFTSQCLPAILAKVFWDRLFKNSHRMFSIRNKTLKNFIKFTRKHLCRNVFFNEVKRVFFLKKKILRRECFPANLVKYLRAPILYNICQRLLLAPTISKYMKKCINSETL